ncbi:MAG: hypothetical protein CL666_01315 [Balneola sp.]|nr:hypothetical protein [Balneola sp.]|tara:strand:- start:217 stop:699 length:483 start_codon:yes stop_codon:yes gene_type:complete
MKYISFFIILLTLGCSQKDMHGIIEDVTEEYIYKTDIRNSDDIYVHDVSFNHLRVFRIAAVEPYTNLNRWEENGLPTEILSMKNHYVLIFDKDKSKINVDEIPEELLGDRNLGSGDNVSEYSPEEWVLIVCSNNFNYRVIENSNYIPIEEFEEIQDFECE